MRKMAKMISAQMAKMIKENMAKLRMEVQKVEIGRNEEGMDGEAKENA